MGFNQSGLIDIKRNSSTMNVAITIVPHELPANVYAIDDSRNICMHELPYKTNMETTYIL